MGWTLRTGRLSDAGSVLLLWAESDAEPTRTDDIASLQRLIIHDPAALIVAEEDGRLVGSVIAGWDGWRRGVGQQRPARPVGKLTAANIALELGRETGGHALPALAREGQPGRALRNR